MKTKKGAVIDKNKNKYIYENLVVDLAKKRIAGKEVKVEFEKSYFGNEKNNPVLKGKVFTQMKNNFNFIRLFLVHVILKIKNVEVGKLNLMNLNMTKRKEFLSTRILVKNF